MPDVIIDYSKIISYISQEIQLIWQGMMDEGSDEVKTLISSIKSIEVSDEQYFRTQEANRKLRRGTVYLVVRFSSGSINFASSVTPVSIYGLGVANQVKPVQLLLGTFASYWTTKNMLQDIPDVEQINDMLQVWNTPEVVSNFNVVDDDFRNLYRVTGNIVIGPAAVRVGTITYYYNEYESVNGNQTLVEKHETINIMSFSDNYHASLDSQPFGNTNGFVQSEVNFSTYTFSFSTYLLNSQFARDILAVRGFRYRPDGVYKIENGKSSTKEKNDIFKLEIHFTNDFTNKPGFDGPDTPESTSATDLVKGDNFYYEFKLVDSQIGQELASIPTLTAAFTR